jgi:hypothetical protein
MRGPRLDLLEICWRFVAQSHFWDPIVGLG